MWYRTAKFAATGIGGGVINPSPKPIVTPTTQNNYPGKALFDQIVYQQNQIDTNYTTDENNSKLGPASESIQSRWTSPYHTDPPFTTLEEQLEAVRQENLANPDSPTEASSNMLSVEGGRGQEISRDNAKKEQSDAQLPQDDNDFINHFNENNLL